MTLPETLPRATPDDEGPFLLENAPKYRAHGRWWCAPGLGYTHSLPSAGRYTKADVASRSAFDTYTYYAVLDPSLSDLGTLVLLDSEGNVVTP